MEQEKKPRNDDGCSNALGIYREANDDHPELIEIHCTWLKLTLILYESHRFFDDYAKQRTYPTSFNTIAAEIAHEFRTYGASSTMLDILEDGAAELSVIPRNHETPLRDRPPKDRIEYLAHCLRSFIIQEQDTPSVSTFRPFLSRFYPTKSAYERDYRRKIGMKSYRLMESNEFRSMIEIKRKRGRPRKNTPDSDT